MLSIIVLVYNRYEMTKQTLDSLQESLKLSPVNCEVIVVDNASGPRTQGLLKSYSRFRTIRLDKNVGVGKGKNIGVQTASHSALYLCDNDIYHYPDWIMPLIETAYEFPEAKVMGVFRHPFHGMKQMHERHGHKFEQSDQQVGSSWFLTKETWDKYGPLREGVSYGIDDVAFIEKVTQDGFWVGSISPHKAYHCGATNSDSRPSPGAELLVKNQPKGVIVK